VYRTEGFKDTFFCKKNTFNTGGKLMSFRHPKVMGIVNLTPDSFWSGSRIHQEKELLERVGRMLEDGADIIDIGGYSSRPGADDVSQEEEMKRVINAVGKIIREYPAAVISVDTFRSAVASGAAGEGASIINDITGGEGDTEMFETIARLKIPYVLMHMRGNPQTMVNLSVYENMLAEILDYFQKKIKQLNEKGVYDIIIDPGFGFAKNIHQNFELLKNLKIFELTGLPVLAGLSRKSMIYKTTGKQPENALAGTVALNMVALQNGANILRVHDVVEAADTIKLFKALYF
jgi:dihydropteroate synthase